MLKAFFLFSGVFCSILLHCAAEKSCSIVGTEAKKQVRREFEQMGPMYTRFDQRFTAIDFEPTSEDISCIKQSITLLKKFSDALSEEDEEIALPTTGLGLIAALYEPKSTDHSYPNIVALATAYAEQEKPAQDEIEDARNQLGAILEANTGFSKSFFEHLDHFTKLNERIEKELEKQKWQINDTMH